MISALFEEDQGHRDDWCVGGHHSEYYTVPSLGGNYSDRYITSLSFLVAGGMLFDGWGDPVTIEPGTPIRGWSEELDCEESYDILNANGLCIGTVPVSVLDALPIVALPVAV